MTKLTPSMKLTAILPWFGSKRTMGQDIATEVGQPSAYFSLCCGSMADLFAKEPSSHETLVDMHGHLMNLGRVLQEDAMAPKLYARLQRTLCGETIFERSRLFYRDHPTIDDADVPNLDCAYHFFLVSWMGRNGVAGTERKDYQMAVRWTPGGGAGGKRFESATESIPWWHQRLRRCLLLRRDIFEVLPKIDDKSNVAMYVDPTYLRETRGGAKYEHEFRDFTGTDRENEDDHARLAEALGRFRHARAVVSYYRHPRLERLYPGWTNRDMTRQKNLHVQNHRGAGKQDAPEVLLINGPSYAAKTNELF